MSLPRTQKSTKLRRGSAGQYSPGVNRNDSDKSLPAHPGVSKGPVLTEKRSTLAPDETDEVALLRELEIGELTPEQLYRLKHSPLLDPDRFSQTEIDEMRADLLQAMNKPVVFQQRRQYTLRPVKLLAQLERALARRRPGQAPRDVFHNFKSNGPTHRLLFGWAALDTVSGLLGPVHHQIFVCGRQAQTGRPHPTALVTQTDLQNALIHSHWTPSPQCRCVSLIARVEVLLNAVLQRIFVTSTGPGRARVMLLMEWSEAPRFHHVVCLDVHAPPKKTGVEAMEVEGEKQKQKKKQAQKAEKPVITEISRVDLFDELAPLEDNEHTALRQLLREGRPSYQFHAFVRRD